MRLDQNLGWPTSAATVAALSRRGLLAAALGAGLILTAAGCGSKDSTAAATASVNGPALNSAQPGTPGGPALTAAKPPRPRVENKHPKVAIDTSLGQVTVELDAVSSPITVENFLAYVDQQFYDQTIIHQVIKDYVVLGGGFTATMVEKRPGAKIRNEAHNGLKNSRGTLAMARQPDAVDSASCQFFFNLKDNGLLDHKDRTLQGYGYCVFGKVVGGMDVLDRIGSVEVRNTEQFEQTPAQPVVVKSIRRLD